MVEAVPRRTRRCYDFEARYEIGRTDFVCPAELPDAVAAEAQELAARGATACWAAAASRAST